jgi:hypothetical protein
MLPRNLRSTLLLEVLLPTSVSTRVLTLVGKRTSNTPLRRVDDNNAHNLTRALRRSTHATRRALCVARTRGTRCRSRLGAAGSLPAGGGGGGGCLAAAGGGWGWLAARGGGQRRRRRWGDFGLNTPFSILRLCQCFSPKLARSYFIFFGASQVRG